MYLFALMKYPKIKSIIHKYLISGHTQNEGDSVHSIIEKAIKKTKVNLVRSTFPVNMH